MTAMASGVIFFSDMGGATELIVSSPEDITKNVPRTLEWNLRGTFVGRRLKSALYAKLPFARRGRYAVECPWLQQRIHVVETVEHVDDFAFDRPLSLARLASDR
jgi:hypothetical protein